MMELRTQGRGRGGIGGQLQPVPRCRLGVPRRRAYQAVHERGTSAQPPCPHPGFGYSEPSPYRTESWHHAPRKGLDRFAAIPRQSCLDVL